MIKKKPDKEQKVGAELEEFTNYLRSELNEDAKRPLLFPLFKKLFKDKFKTESEVSGADIYIEGQLIVEAKSNFEQWQAGFYQALHYHKRYGLTYPAIMVVAHEFVGIWKLNKLPETAVLYSHTADAQKAPSAVGTENAKKTTKALSNEIKDSAFYWLSPKDLKGDIFGGAKNLITESYEILKILRNLDSDRLQINTHNFIDSIELMKPFFAEPIDAVHCFYTIIAYWDITSTLSQNEYGDKVEVIGFKGSRHSEAVTIDPRKLKDFKKFIEGHYIFTNEGSGLTVDYYFSRFDEVMARIDPEYVKQHGIFFTDSNLSKFALWFVKNHFPGDINENYIVFDPAGGSGNLVSSWRGKLKHKIISELQPDLLKTIERRMRVDPFHTETGFTIIPKTSENKGLNFLDHSAKEYLDELKKELKLKNILLDKPIAFLLNPPYKNTKENEIVRSNVEANYLLHESITEIAGDEATIERYLAFLAQIINISKIQGSDGLKPIVLVFTPTSWLIPRPAFIHFRNVWDRFFKYENGLIVTSNEFFELDGKWPLSFTIWSYDPVDKRENNIDLYDCTSLSKQDLREISWFSNDDVLVDKELNLLTENLRKVSLSRKRETLREKYDLKLYDFIRTPSKKEAESEETIGGLPLKDERRGNNKTYGTPSSNVIGFMDNSTPARIKIRGESARFTKNNLHSVWFRLDTSIKDVNKAKCFNGAADNRSYCAYNLESAKATFTWFAICKAINGKYPLWANQFDIWNPQIPKKKLDYWYSLCFAFVLSENRSVVTKFPANDPVPGAEEVYIDNPLCPINPISFWSTTLNSQIISTPDTGKNLVDKIRELYQLWAKKYCKGQNISPAGLHEEAYFKYFDYPDFLTPYSGLIQIRKYAELEEIGELIELFAEISALTKLVREEIYQLLVKDAKYFE